MWIIQTARSWTGCPATRRPRSRGTRWRPISSLLTVCCEILSRRGSVLARSSRAAAVQRVRALCVCARGPLPLPSPPLPCCLKCDFSNLPPRPLPHVGSRHFRAQCPNTVRFPAFPLFPRAFPSAICFAIAVDVEWDRRLALPSRCPGFRALFLRFLDILLLCCAFFAQ